MPLSLATTGSSNLRPISRLMAKKVLVGLVTAWRFAGWPTRRSPSSMMPTTEGVVRTPSAFSITFGDLPSMMATHELVVPRSIPIILLMTRLKRSLSFGGRGWAASLEHRYVPPPWGFVSEFKRKSTLGGYSRVEGDMGTAAAAARGQPGVTAPDSGLYQGHGVQRLSAHFGRHRRGGRSVGGRRGA